jgi:hypothetical protein
MHGYMALFGAPLSAMGAIPLQDVPKNLVHCVLAVSSRVIHIAWKAFLLPTVLEFDDVGEADSFRRALTAASFVPGVSAAQSFFITPIYGWDSLVFHYSFSHDTRVCVSLVVSSFFNFPFSHHTHLFIM